MSRKSIPRFITKTGQELVILIMNYDSAGLVGAVSAGGLLAMTGVSGVIWILLASFALIAAGSAILRIVPRREK